MKTKICFYLMVQIMISCSIEKKEISDNGAESSIEIDSIEISAYKFLKDSLLTKRGLLLAKDSFYLKIGLEEDLTSLLNSRNYRINTCDDLLTRPTNFSDDPDLSDSLRRQTILFENDYEDKKNKSSKLFFIADLKRDSLRKSLLDSVMFITVRNHLKSKNIAQVEIDVCEKSGDYFDLFVFNFFLSESLEIIDWQFHEEVNFDSGCRMCPPLGVE